MKIRGAIKRAVSRKTGVSGTPSYEQFAPLDFKQIEKSANGLADLIETKFEALAHILLEYESYEVVCDEIGRTIDLLRNLKENKAYFRVRIGDTAAFLPRNQPLYALSCFVIIPSLMARKVHFRIPHSMRRFFPKLLALLELYERFPNIAVSHKERGEFLAERTALLMDPKTKETIPVTEAVVFTGTSVHADQLRLLFDERTLFITNGAGHNPVVVAKDANLRKAVEAVITLQLYNQGQDCAAPNAILVQKDIYQDFLRLIRDELRAVRVGQYADRTCRVGPISDPKDLVRVQDLLIRNREWLDPTTPGIIRAHDAILEPTIVAKPLSEGGNFSEVFAPIIFLQKYETDADLARYFEDAAYAPNAMYVTLYGTSAYVRSLAGKKFGGKMLHDKASILRNTHLHAPGIERGVAPYGGYGYGASNLSFKGKITPKPTLPQRDIFEHLAKPLLAPLALGKARANAKRFTKQVVKDLSKLMRARGSEAKEGGEGELYVDTAALKRGSRYVRIPEDASYRLLDAPNVEHIARLGPDDLALVRKLRKLLSRPKLPAPAEFSAALYALPKEPGASDKKNKERQLRFFRTTYRLLLGTDSGPRLAQFLEDIDRPKACVLLDV